MPSSSKVEDCVAENANVLLTRDGMKICKSISEQTMEDPTAFDTKVVAFKEAVQGSTGLKHEADDAVDMCFGIEFWWPSSAK